MATQLEKRDIDFLNKLKSEGVSEDRQYDLLNKARQKNGLPPVEPAGKVGEFFTGIGKGLYGVGSQLSRLAPGDQSADPNSYYNRTQELMKLADVERQKAGQNTESFTSKAGEFVGQALPTIPVSMGVGALLRGGVAALGTVAPKVASAVSPFVTAPGASATLGNIVKFGVGEGAKDQAIFDLMSQGETSATNIAIGGVAGGLLGAGFKGLSKLGGKINELPVNKSKIGTYTETTSDLLSKARSKGPIHFVENSLGFTPRERSNFARINGVEPAEYLLDRKLADKPKEELLQYFSNQFEGAMKKKSSLLKPINQRYTNPNVDEMLTKIKGYVEDAGNTMRKSDYETKMNVLNDLLSRKAYTLQETNDIIREFDNWLNLFDAQGYVKGTGANKSLASLRDDVLDFLEKEGKKNGIDISQINKDIRTGVQMKKALIRTISQQNKNNAIGLQDMIMGGILSGGDPFSGLATIVAKKGLESKIPAIAQKLYKKSNVKSLIPSSNTIPTSNRTVDSIFSNTMDNVGELPQAVKELPPPSGLPLSNKNVKIPSSTKDIILLGPEKKKPKIRVPGTYTEN